MQARRANVLGVGGSSDGHTKKNKKLAQKGTGTRLTPGAATEATTGKQRIRRVKAAVAGARSGATGGMASTIAFTPVQGIELVNPNAGRERMAEITKRYFSRAAAFLNAKKRKQGAKGERDTALKKVKVESE